MTLSMLHSCTPSTAAFKGRAAAGARVSTGRPGSHAVRCCAASGASRRDLLVGSGALATLVAVSRPQLAHAEFEKALCDAACLANLEQAERVTTPSGLQYSDIVVGKGPSPPVGFQVVCHYVAMTPAGRVFDSSLERGSPYDIRVGAGQVIPGLDEGLLTMKAGGLRRLYIPGSLAFTKALKAAAGRPTIPANSPVVFDVQLLYIPGLEDDE